MTTINPTSRDRGPARRRLAAVNWVTRLVLHSPILHWLLDRVVCELRFTGRRSGRAVALPVMYARAGDDLVILGGGAAGKTWWRNFERPCVVHVRVKATYAYRAR